jgi:hypothetical protein
MMEVIDLLATYRKKFGMPGSEVSVTDYHCSALGPSQRPRQAVMTMPRVYQTATKVTEVSGQAREYPMAPTLPANSPAAKPAPAGAGRGS